MKKQVFIILTCMLLFFLTACQEQNEADFEDFLVPIDYEDETIVYENEPDSNVIISKDVISEPDVISTSEAVESITETEYSVPAAIIIPDNDRNVVSQAEATPETSVTIINGTEMVWKSNSGSKYHSNRYCSNMKTATEITKQEAIAIGLDACKKCH